jgi:hypothetical protein
MLTLALPGYFTSMKSPGVASTLLINTTSLFRPQFCRNKRNAASSDREGGKLTMEEKEKQSYLQGSGHPEENNVAHRRPPEHVRDLGNIKSQHAFTVWLTQIRAMREDIM